MQVESPICPACAAYRGIRRSLRASIAGEGDPRHSWKHRWLGGYSIKLLAIGEAGKELSSCYQKSSAAERPHVAKRSATRIDA